MVRSSGVLASRDLTPAGNGSLPTGWKYLGCYLWEITSSFTENFPLTSSINRDLVSPRTLTGDSYVDGNSMSNEACSSYCQGKNYTFAGMEYYQECCEYTQYPSFYSKSWRLTSNADCGDFFTANTSTPITDCNTACTGKSSEPCGGSNRMSIFWNGTRSAPIPVSNPGPVGWKWLGCYS